MFTVVVVLCFLAMAAAFSPIKSFASKNFENCLKAEK